MESYPSFNDFLVSDSDPPSSSSINNNQNTKLEWCTSCFNQAQEMENRHRKSIGLVKKKIIFTDHLIGLYKESKSSLEESQLRVKTLELECKRKETDNFLINKQLKALLSDHHPTELQQHKDENASLKQALYDNNDQICSLQMAQKMLELKINSLNDELKLKEIENKNMAKAKAQLQKELDVQKKLVFSGKKENKALVKKNEVLQERLRKKRSRGSGSFSHTTDSEHNLTAPSEEIRTENDDTGQSSSVFKSPLAEKKKKVLRKRRKMSVIPVSDEDGATTDNQDGNISLGVTEIKEQPESEHIVIEPNEIVDEVENRLVTTSSALDVSPDKKVEVKMSSSDNASDANKKDVASNAMKARLLDMKKKRAYRSFCNHPSTTQLNGLKDIVTQAKEDTSSLKEAIDQFCSKHLLTGHESYVARKIERLHKDLLDASVLEKLHSLQSSSNNSTGKTGDNKKNNVSTEENKENVSKISTTENKLERLKVATEPDKPLADREDNAIPPKSIPQSPGLDSNTPVVEIAAPLNETQTIIPVSNSNQTKTKPVSSDIEQSALTANLQDVNLITAKENEILSKLPPPEKLSSTSTNENNRNDKQPVPIVIDQDVDVVTAKDEISSKLPPEKLSSVSVSNENLDVKQQAPPVEDQNVNIITAESNEISSKLPSPEKLSSTSLNKDVNIITPKENEISSKLPSPEKLSSTSLNKDVNIITPKESEISSKLPPPEKLSSTLPNEDIHVVNSLTKNSQSSMFSSDENEDDDEPVTANICPANDPGVIISSIPSSPKDKLEPENNIGKSSMPKNKRAKAKKSKRKAKTKAKKGRRNRSETDTDSAVAAVVSSKPSSLSEFSSDSEKSDSVPLSVLIKRSRTKSENDPKKSPPRKLNNKIALSSASKNLSLQSQVTSSVSKTKGNANFMKTSITTKSTVKTNTVQVSRRISSISTKRKKNDSPLLDKKIAKSDSSKNTSKTQSSQAIRPPPFESFQSQPFSVDPETPVSAGSQSCSFLPVSASNPSLSDSSDDNEPIVNFAADFMNPSKLHGIFENMNLLMNLTPLSPLHTDDPQYSSSQSDVALDVDTDDRGSISPSADLCTAINFPSSKSKPSNMDKVQEKSNSNSKHFGIKTKQSTGDLSSSPCMGDAPRRFSCEAPVLARTVPTVKRVCKTQSLDPSVLLSIDETPSKISKSSSSDVLIPEDSPTSKILPSNLKIIPGTYSGPFKFVSSGSPHSDPTPPQVGLPHSSPTLHPNSNPATTPMKSPVLNSYPPLMPPPLADPTPSQMAPRNKDTDPISVQAKPLQSETTAQKSSPAQYISTSSNSKPVSLGKIKNSVTQDCRVVVNDLSQPNSQNMNLNVSRNVNETSLSSSSLFVNSPSTKLKSPLQDVLEQIQSHAFIVPPNKTYSALSASLVIDWLAVVLEKSRDHDFDAVLSSHAEAKKDMSKLQPGDFLHEWENQFITMIMAVDEIRAKKGREIIEPVVIPTIMKLLCRFGCSLITSQVAIKDYESIAPLKYLLKKDKLEMNATRSLVRLLSCLCRRIASPDVALDFCRYTVISKSLIEVDSLLFECVACYPDAFAKHFQLSGKLLVSTLAFRADKHIFANKSDKFKQEVRSRIHHLELILGWNSSSGESLTDEKVRDRSIQNVLEQCLLGINTASFVDVSNQAAGNKIKHVVLSAPNLNDVFRAFEIFACVKAVPFITVDIIDRKFWPLLNLWSRHLVTQPSDTNNKQVSDACIAAVIHAISVMLLTLITKQQACHPTQPFVRQTTSYFDTICSLLANFTARHLETAPHCVQCVTAATVLKLGFYKPALTYKTVYEWFESSKRLFVGEKPTKRGKNKIHLTVAQLEAFYPDKSLKKMVAWLELQTKSFRRDQKFPTSLTNLLWG